MQNCYSSSKSKVVDSRLDILILQTICVGVIIVAAVVFRMFGGEIYSEISRLYREKFNEITTVDEVLEAEDLEEVEYKETNALSSFDETEDEVEDSVVGYMTKEETFVYESSPASNVNSLIWPVEGAVTSEYGYRIHPITGKNSMHGGIDIKADSGTAIKSVFFGKISKKGYSNSYGYYVIIKHSDGFETLYAHCSKILVEEGDEVEKGDEIALVGNTGQSTGPHLHFEIRIGGMRTNPRWLLCEAISV